MYSALIMWDSDLTFPIDGVLQETRVCLESWPMQETEIRLLHFIYQYIKAYSNSYF